MCVVPLQCSYDREKKSLQSAVPELFRTILVHNKRKQKHVCIFIYLTSDLH